MKYELNRMSWKEAENAIKKNPIAILPIGTTEQNGPHIPLGNDAIVADYVSREIAKRSNCLLLPLISYGCSRQFRNFSGTLWIRPETLQSLVYDIGLSLVNHGCKGLIIANNHGTNHFPVEQALRQIMEDTDMKAISFWPSRVLRKLGDEFYKDRPEILGHGGEPMTSVIMAIAGYDVVTDEVLDTCVKVKSIGNFQVQDSSNSKFNDCPVNLYLDMKEINPNGQTGDARVGSAELGKVLLERTIKWGVEMVYEFRKEVVKVDE